MNHIYLAGPITGCTYRNCTSWRHAFEEFLAEAMQNVYWRPEEVRCLSPMRAKDYLNQVGVINKDYPSFQFGPLSCSRGIISRDFFDCTRSDLLVVNLLGATITSIGTMMELAWAYQKRTPSIVIMEREGNLHEHPFVWETTSFRVTSIEEAVHTALAVLWPRGT